MNETDDSFVREAMEKLGFECDFADLDPLVMSSVLRLAAIIKRNQTRRTNEISY